MIRTKTILFIFVSITMIFGCGKSEEMKNGSKSLKVITGADRLVSEKINILHNKNLGIITNHTAVLSNGVHLVDSLNNVKNVNIVALFGPEHGIRGDAPDGLKIKDGVDAKTGIPVYSLYGKNRKPTKEMLDGIDLLIFDIQDIGARFYTFISTMYYAIEAAADNNIQIMILDRPNPINGVNVDGPIRKEEFKSFVAIAPVPIMHGMTVGELAMMFNEELMIESDKKADLIVMTMKNWKREFYFDDCGLEWINPSPNIPSLETAIIYPGACFIEGTNISEGRGTLNPFLTIGAPFVNSSELVDELNSLQIEGLRYKPKQFTPKEIPNMASNPKYEAVLCNGLEFEITDRNKFNAVQFGIKLVYALHKLYPDNFEFRRNWLDRLFGDTYFKEMLVAGNNPNEIISVWQEELEDFKILRDKYLLYR